MVTRLSLLSAVTSLAVFYSTTPVDAHSFLVKPVARDNKYHSDVTNTVGCPSKTVGKVTSFRAGDSIDVRYWRNNHIGGFIRWSIAPRGSETKADFDRNAFYYTCRESGPTCTPKKNADRPIAGDSSGTNTISCGDKIALPDWLPAGDYVLQWTWFGVGHSAGNLGWAEPQFRSCADIKLTTSGAKKAAPSCPTFVGGDRVTKSQNKPSDQCFYFYTTDIVNSQYKGSNVESVAMPLYKFGVPAAVKQCQGSGSAGGNATSGGGDNEEGEVGNDTGADDGTATLVPSTVVPESDAPETTSKPTPTTVLCHRKED